MDKNIRKYTGKSTIIATHGWLDCNMIIKYKYFDFSFKILAATALLLNVLLACHKWYYTSAVMAFISLAYSIWNFALWGLTYSIEETAFRRMFLFEGIIGAIWASYLTLATFFFVDGCWLMVMVPLAFVGLEMYMIYSAKEANSYFSHRSISLIEAVQVFGISLKLLKLAQLSWPYTLTFFALHSLYTAVMGFVCLLLYCNMRFRGMQAHPFLPGLRFFALNLLANGLVYQQLLSTLPLLYTYPDRLAENQANTGSEGVVQGNSLVIQACIYMIAANLLLVFLLASQRSQIQYQILKSDYSSKMLCTCLRQGRE